MVILRIHTMCVPCVVPIIIFFFTHIQRHFSNKSIEVSRNFWTSRFAVSDYVHAHNFPLSIILSDIKSCRKQVFTNVFFLFWNGWEPMIMILCSFHNHSPQSLVQKKAGTGRNEHKMCSTIKMMVTKMLKDKNSNWHITLHPLLLSLEHTS